jgi:hypothetical protein
MSKTEAIGDMVVLFIFGDQVEFDAEVAAAGARMRGDREGATRSIYRVAFRSQPEIVEDFR